MEINQFGYICFFAKTQEVGSSSPTIAILYSIALGVLLFLPSLYFFLSVLLLTVFLYRPHQHSHKDLDRLQIGRKEGSLIPIQGINADLIPSDFFPAEVSSNTEALDRRAESGAADN